MIKWFFSTLLVAAVAAGVMILYLSPDLRSKAAGWFKQKNELVERRAKQIKDSLPGKTDLKQAKDRILPKDQTGAGAPRQETKPVEKKTNEQAKTPMQDQISDQDRQQLEKVLEQAQKVNPGQKK